ncbi:hypothetical protein OEZ85_009954 [Tetradesmus obliquus]|uniref:SET domain-containing protein n=1 Tax=Tetradesmus obliquus TaxID=3088 RepID=A0ABY8UDF9_TETOB|nr:hypothetical protein OEZ85_009954 [Tetradesmus obliquus]
MHALSELEGKKGGSFWESAVVDDEEEEEEEEYEDGGEDEEEDEDEVGVEEVASLMRELAEGLGDEEEEQQQGQTQPAAAAAAAWRACYISRQVPAPQLGPVALKAAPGKGWGLFTTAAVAAGDLLLVAQPLALLYCEEGTTPENEELAEALAAAAAATAAAAGAQPASSSSSSGSSGGGLSLWQQHALLQLRATGEGPDTAAVDPQLLQQLLGDPADVIAAPQIDQASSNSSSEEASTQQQQQQQQVAPLPPASAALPGADRVLQIVHANCTGEEFEDAALALLRGSTSCGHLGVWPAAAMINHACCPNAHALLIGDRLVVRAAEDIAAGQQVTLSYLGPQLFAPAAVRQEELRQQWGFDCGCARCKAEARYAGSSSSSESTTLSQLLMDTYTACQGMAEQLDEAVDEDDAEAVAAMQQQLQGMQQKVEAGIRAAKPPANVRRWLQASVYDLYDLLSLCADQLPAAPPKAAASGRRGPGKKQPAAPAIESEALAACARIVGAVTPGSSAHADLTTEYMVRSEARFGEGHQEAADALRMCSAAHVARYGPISKGLLQLLMDTRAGAALL